MPGHGATRSFHYYPIVLIGLTFAITSASVELASPPSPQNLVIGTSTALSGPAKEIGLDVVGGINAAFIEANRNASQSGFVVQLVTRDDAYDPAKTAENMEALIKKDKVIAVLGNVGSPTAVVSVLMANEHRIPFIGAYSGAGLLRKSPPDRYVVNFRASYDEEVASMIRGFVDVAGVSPTSIAFFTQRDAFGDASFNGGHRELTQHNLPSGYFIPHLRYERSGAGVESAVADLLLLPETPRVVIMAGTYGPCAKFIQLATENGLNIQYAAVSFVGTASLIRDLGELAEGIIITQVVPSPESDLPAAKTFRAALHASNPVALPTFGAFEGYLASQILFRGIQASRLPVTPDSIIDALESLGDFDIGIGATLHLSESNHQASHTIWPTRIIDGKAIEFCWETLRLDTHHTGNVLH